MARPVKSMTDNSANDTARYKERRRRMVEKQIHKRGIKDPRVLHAFLQVPRHLFMDEALRDRAYEDHPLPIGKGQTISQPYTVAFMTEALKLDGDEKVLEVGSGCGYQTAILLELAPQVFAIERIASLARRSQKTLDSLGYTGFVLKVRDGTRGWPEYAPFDAIIVAAAAPHVPPSLKNQLVVGGRLVIPVGDKHVQGMIRITRLDEENFKEEDLGSFRFVGLIGAEGWKENETI